MQYLDDSHDTIYEVHGDLFDYDGIREIIKKTTNIKIKDSKKTYEPWMYASYSERMGPKLSMIYKERPGFIRTSEGCIYGRSWMKYHICKQWKKRKCWRHWTKCIFFHICHRCLVIGEHVYCHRKSTKISNTIRMLRKSTEMSSAVDQNHHNYADKQIEFKHNYNNNNNNNNHNNTIKYYDNKHKHGTTEKTNISNIKQREQDKSSIFELQDDKSCSDDDDDDTDTTIYNHHDCQTKEIISNKANAHQNKLDHACNADLKQKIDLNHDNEINFNYYHNNDADQDQELGKVNNDNTNGGPLMIYLYSQK